MKPRKRREKESAFVRERNRERNKLRVWTYEKDKGTVCAYE